MVGFIQRFLDRLLRGTGRAQPAHLVLPPWHDSMLGDFEPDDGSDEVLGSVTWHGRTVDLCLSPGEFMSMADVTALARALVRDEARVDAAINALLVSELLPQVNDERLSEDDPRLDAEGFLALLSLYRITQHGDGYYSALYLVDEHIGGHGLEVMGTLEGGPVDAAFMG